MHVKFNLSRNRVSIGRRQQFANSIYVLAENFVESRHVLGKEHRSGRAVDFIDPQVRIYRDDAGRNALQNDFHIPPARFKLTCGALELLCHIVEQTNQKTKFILSLYVDAMSEITCRDLTSGFG